MLAGMIEDRRLTTKEERKWRAEFKALGREAVRARSPAFQPHIKRDLAVRWLREQEGVLTPGCDGHIAKTRQPQGREPTSWRRLRSAP